MSANYTLLLIAPKENDICDASQHFLSLAAENVHYIKQFVATPVWIFYFFYFCGFEIRLIHLISSTRQVLHGQWHLLSVMSNLFMHSVFNYPWTVQIHFSLCMLSVH